SPSRDSRNNGSRSALTVSKRILYISYDERTLISRRALLERQGYAVASACSFTESAALCWDGECDLLILGYSIPRRHKEQLLSIFRSRCAAPVLSLWRRREPIVEAVNYVVFSDDPEQLLKSVATILLQDAPIQVSVT